MTAAAGASLLLIGALKGSCLLLASAMVALALRHSSAAIRHVAWTTGIVAVLLVAPVSKIVPTWRVPVSADLPLVEQIAPSATRVAPQQIAVPMATPIPAPPNASPAPTSPPLRSLSLYSLLVPVWIIGVAALGFWFLAGAWRLSRIVRSASPVDDSRIADLAEASARELGVSRSRFRLRWTDATLTPMSWGFLRPFILLPHTSATWTDERIRQILIHEIGHVQRWDVLTQALSSLACTIYWFNPLVWWAARQMLVERERACDDLVLNAGSAPSTYAHELLEIARSLGAGWTTARVSTAMARKSQISGRLLAVLDSKRSRVGVRRSVTVIGAVLALAVLIPAASLTIKPIAASAAPIIAATVPSTTTEPAIAVASIPPDLLAEFQPAIAAVQRSMLGALRRRDAHAMASHYTQDALLVSSAMPAARGRRAIEATMQQLIDSGVVTFDVQTRELHPVGDMVCEIGRITYRLSTGQEVGTSSFMSLWKKEEGEWRIHRDFVTP